MKKVQEVLCNRVDENSYNERVRQNARGNLKSGMELTCFINDGKGSCGLDFYADDGKYCVWCCQILKYSNLGVESEALLSR